MFIGVLESMAILAEAAPMPRIGTVSVARSVRWPMIPEALEKLPTLRVIPSFSGIARRPRDRYLVSIILVLSGRYLPKFKRVRRLGTCQVITPLMSTLKLLRPSC